MHHCVRIFDQRIHEIGIRNISHDQFATLRVQSFQAGSITRVGEFVQYRHGMLGVFEHMTDEIGSDETGTTSDKKFSHNR